MSGLDVEMGDRVTNGIRFGMIVELENREEAAGAAGHLNGNDKVSLEDSNGCLPLQNLARSLLSLPQWLSRLLQPGDSTPKRAFNLRRSRQKEIIDAGDCLVFLAPPAIPFAAESTGHLVNSPADSGSWCMMDYDISFPEPTTNQLAGAS